MLISSRLLVILGLLEQMNSEIGRKRPISMTQQNITQLEARKLKNEIPLVRVFQDLPASVGAGVRAQICKIFVVSLHLVNTQQ